MAIWYLGSVSEVCAVSEVLYSVFDGHYTEAGNSLVPEEEKGRRAHAMHVTYLRRRETCPHKAHFISYDCVSPFYLTCTKISIDYSPRDAPCANTLHACWHTYAHVCVSMGMSGLGARSTLWSTSCLTSLKPLYYRGFKSRWALLLVGEVGLNF
jgi:hypothetical protein